MPRNFVLQLPDNNKLQAKDIARIINEHRMGFCARCLEITNIPKNE